MTLNSLNQAKIEKLKHNDLVVTLQKMRPFFRKGVWVGPRNRYSQNPIKTTNDEIKLGALRSPKDLSQYIAASTILHCSDGWSYLGAALSSLLRGDPHRSRHLAYYAELRAAMSLLASLGVGVFNTKHFVVASVNSAVPLPKGSKTHEFVWDCIEFLGTSDVLGNMLAHTMRPGGVGLTDWLQPIGGISIIAPFAREWFLQWGQDLKMPETDHNARNESSYRPDGLPVSWYSDAKSVLEFVRELWLALEPSQISTFDTIDRHILRIGLEKHYNARYGAIPKRRRPEYAEIVGRIVSAQSFPTPMADSWQSFLLRVSASQDHPLLVASRESAKTRHGSELAIVARATLLLRAASGTTQRLFQDARFDAHSTDFWRERLSLGRGLWDGVNDSLQATDLWADTWECITEIQTFQENTRPEDQTFFRISTELGRAIAGICKGERVAIWSMAT